jgi:hypothetical protein
MNNILTNYDTNNQTQVENYQERHFLRINKINAKNIAGGSALIKRAAKAPSIHTKFQALAGPSLMN